jgi:hypothetical protein
MDQNAEDWKAVYCAAITGILAGRQGAISGADELEEYAREVADVARAIADEGMSDIAQVRDAGETVDARKLSE